MKTPHRPFLGIALLLAAFFLAFSPSCGALGWALNRGASWLLGQAGSTLLGVGLFLSGLLLVIPLQAWVKFFKWQPRAAREPAAPVRPIVHEKVVKLSSVPAGTLGEVHHGLVHCGYLPSEFRDLLAKMDPARGTEQLLRDALKELRAPTAVAS